MLRVHLIVLILTYCSAKRWPVSYTAGGSWDKAPKGTQDCKRWTCTPTSRLIWNQTTNVYALLTNTTACERLKTKGITKISFYGDSYMRHIYAAMLITLNGNYATGSLSDPSKSRCRYQSQFSEKYCNLNKLNRRGVMCDGKLILDAQLTNAETVTCSSQPGHVVLYSAGNHAIGTNRKDRYGVNNATAYQLYFQQALCPRLLALDGDHAKCQVWWVSTHHRLMGMYRDETAALVHGYNLRMRAFFDSGACGPVGYIDVYNMTAALVRKHTSDARDMTYDNVHWGYEVNLVKAQIVLNALLSV